MWIFFLFIGAENKTLFMSSLFLQLFQILVYCTKEICVSVCLCGRVQLVAGFIYLILNLSSNSLIGQFHC